MQLQSISYAEWEGTEQEWVLNELRLGSRNLIVGKNASGKSRAINVINGLSRQLAGLIPASLSGNYVATFTDKGKTLKYELKYLEEEVLLERFSDDGKVLLDRGAEGKGVIWAEQIGREIPFQAPRGAIAAFVRRDAIQHGFLEPLYVWGSSVRLYYFGTAFGKDAILFLVEGGPKPDERDANAVMPIFRKAKKELREAFTKAVISDMASLGYEIEQIDVGPPTSMRVTSELPIEPVGLFVKEKSLRGVTDQYSMSQGMYRALALFIHVNYAHLSHRTSCILIDDIGEGLDFDRSCRLIDTLRKKTEGSGIQLVLTTNDRFVMNRVPLEEWSVLSRSGNQITAKNYQNSKPIFDEFKFTGLSNFSLLELDLLGDSKATESPKIE